MLERINRYEAQRPALAALVAEINKRRKARGWTYDILAYKASISRPGVAQIMSLHKMPRWPLLRRLVNAVDCELQIVDRKKGT